MFKLIPQNNPLPIIKDTAIDLKNLSFAKKSLVESLMLLEGNGYTLGLAGSSELLPQIYWGECGSSPLVFSKRQEKDYSPLYFLPRSL